MADLPAATGRGLAVVPPTAAEEEADSTEAEKASALAAPATDPLAE